MTRGRWLLFPIQNVEVNAKTHPARRNGPSGEGLSLLGLETGPVGAQSIECKRKRLVRGEGESELGRGGDEATDRVKRAAPTQGRCPPFEKRASRVSIFPAGSCTAKKRNEGPKKGESVSPIAKDDLFDLLLRKRQECIAFGGVAGTSSPSGRRELVAECWRHGPGIEFGDRCRRGRVEEGLPRR